MHCRILLAVTIASLPGHFAGTAFIWWVGALFVYIVSLRLLARWEYRPGSTLFLVWTQGRDQSDRDVGTFDASRDYRNLFAARPDNVFLVKAAYWLGR